MNNILVNWYKLFNSTNWFCFAKNNEQSQSQKENIEGEILQNKFYTNHKNKTSQSTINNIDEKQPQDFIKSDQTKTTQEHKEVNCFDQQLSNLISDYNRFPEDTFEKLLLKQIIYYFPQNNQLKNKLAIQSNLQKLKNQYIKQYGQNQDILQIIDNCQISKKKAYQNLCLLQQKIMLINILELQRLINKTNEDSQKINGKNILLCIGMVGSGKSTNILRFLNYNLVRKQQKILSGELSTFITEGQLKLLHKNFHTSPLSKSCTRHINAAKIPAKMFPVGTKTELWICDSPGFGDTGVIQIDIANGVGMINALRECQSVKIAVILSKEIEANRLKGVITIAEILSNLFKQLDHVLKGTIILFNKYQNQIDKQQLQAKIEDKISHLSPQQRANKNLLKFLEKMISQAKNPINFVDPLNGNYKVIIEKIMKQVNPIKRLTIQENFTYNFIDTTSKQIQYFTTTLIKKIKQKFQQGKLSQASFNLELLTILKDILTGTNTVQTKYKNVIKWIEQRSQVQLASFKQKLTDIIEGHGSQKLYNQIKNSLSYMNKIQSYFIQFKDLNIPGQILVNQIQNAQNLLIQQLKDFSQNQGKLLLIIKFFLKELDSKFQEKICQKLYLLYSQSNKVFNQLYKHGKYEQSKECLNKLKQICYILNQLKINHQSINHFQKIKKMIGQNVNEIKTFLFQFIQNQLIRLSDKQITPINQKYLKRLQQINELNIVNADININDIINNFKKHVELKCIKYLKQLLDIFQFDNIQQVKKSKILEQLKAKKTQIIYLMKIKDIRQKISIYYLQILEDINKKLLQKVQMIKQITKALKRFPNKTQIQDNTQKICSLRLFILQCCQIIDKQKSNDQKQVMLFDKQLKEYLIYQKIHIKSLDHDLTLFNPQDNNYEKTMKSWCVKIKCFKKLSTISQQIQILVTNIVEDFHKILLIPYNKFCQSILPKIEDKFEYESLLLNLIPLQNICFYLLNVSLFLNQQHYHDFSINDQKIKTILENKINLIEIDSKAVIQNLDKQTIGSQQYLKYLISTLAQISNKKNIFTYLSNQFNFNPQNILKKIQYKSKVKYSQLNHKYRSIIKYNQHSLIQELTELAYTCKQFIIIQQQLRYYDSQKIFSELIIQIQKTINQHSKDEYQTAQQILQYSNNSEINFITLKQIYNKFKKMKTAVAIKIIKLIINGVSKISRLKTEKLKKIYMQVINEKSFLKSSKKLSQSFEQFSAALVFESQLNIIFLGQQKKIINISNQLLLDLGNQIIQLFKSQFLQIYKNIMQFNLVNMEYNIKYFGHFQSMIYKQFVDKKPLIEYSISNLLQFIEYNKNQLKKIIEKDTLNDQNVNFNRSQKNLKGLLQKLYNKMLKFVQKYKQYGPKFEIDQNFKIYYSFQMLNKDKNNHIDKLNNNINAFYKNLFKNLIISSQISQKQNEIMINKIQSSLKNTPPLLQIEYQNQYNLIRQKIKKQNQQKIQKIQIIVLKIQTNHDYFDTFFIQILKAGKNKQSWYYIKLIQQFEAICRQKSKSIDTLKDRIKFIYQYFIRNIEINKNLINHDSTFIKKINKLYQQQIEILIQTNIRRRFSQLLQIIQNPSNSIYLNSSMLLKQIFEVFRFINKLKLDTFKINRQFKERTLIQMSSKIRQIIQTFTQNYKKSYINNLQSQQSLDQNNIKEFMKYIQYITNAGYIIQLLKIQLRNLINLQQIVADKLKIFKDMIQCINFKQTIISYEKQIINMVKFVNKYEFFNEKIKNWSKKEYQQNITRLELIYCILKNRKEFFRKFILLDRQNMYQISNIQQKIKQQYQKCYKTAIIQTNRIFNDTKRGFTSQINAFLVSTSIMIQKNVTFCDYNMYFSNYSKFMEKQLKVNFRNLKNKTMEKFKKAKDLMTYVYKSIRIQQTKKANQILQLRSCYKDKLEPQNVNSAKAILKEIAKQNDFKQITLSQQKSKIQQNNFIACNEQQKNDKINQVSRRYDTIIQELKQQLIQPIKVFSESLILYKKILLDVSIDNGIDFNNILEQIRKCDPKFVDMLAQVLDSDHNDDLKIGKIILATSSVFQAYINKVRTQQTKTNDIKSFIEHLQKIQSQGKINITQQIKASILRQFQQYQLKFSSKKFIYKQLPYSNSIQKLVKMCKNLSQQQAKRYFSKNHRQPHMSNRIQLLAQIFAIHSILKSQKYQDQIYFPIDPHPSIIATLILLLDIFDRQHFLQHSNVLLETQQGKQTILSILCCYLSLMGFNVKCTSYKNRDQNIFKQMFKLLNIQSKIKYGNLTQLCQDILNSKEFDFKNEVQNNIFRKEQNFIKKIISISGYNSIQLTNNFFKTIHPTILIIGQVDALFDEDYFGKSYYSELILQGPTIKDVLQNIWEKVKIYGYKIDVQRLKTSKQFRQLKNRYKQLDDILQNQIYGMVAGALQFNHTYSIVDSRIVYEDNDGKLSNINYKYKTVFANIFQYANGNILESNYKDALKLTLTIAQFSYILLQKYFKKIIGFAENLQVISKFKKEQLQKIFNFKQKYAISPVLCMDHILVQNYYVVKEQNFNNKIIERLNQVKNKRPIIILFKNAVQLKKFYNCPDYTKYIKRTLTLSEEHTEAIRNSIIAKAAYADSITLITNFCGKDIQFILYDTQIKEAGGFYIIQAFLSQMQSQEIRIKNKFIQRRKQSYDCIINQKSLQLIDLKMSDIPQNSTSINIVNIIQKARYKKIQQIQKKSLDQLQEYNIRHRQTIQVYSRQKLKQHDLINYISALNIYPKMIYPSTRIILCINIAQQMELSLFKHCLIFEDIFTRVYNIINEKGIKGYFEIKIMSYRNYKSSKKEKIEFTAFQNVSYNLNKFLLSIQADSDWSHAKSVESFIDALNKQTLSIDQAILIGDAGIGNILQQTDMKEKKLNQSSNNLFFTQKINLLINQFNKRPIHTLYRRNQQIFKQISKRTNGHPRLFDLCSRTAKKDLTAFIVKNILTAIGKKISKNISTNLIYEYKKKYE